LLKASIEWRVNLAGLFPNTTPWFVDRSSHTL
jgi:hypothetical protein